MRSLALAVLLLAPASALGSAAPTDPGSPLAWSLEPTAQPGTLHAGEHGAIELRVQRTAHGQPLPGPGRAELALAAPEPAGCEPEHQTVALDPTTGEATATIDCRPQRPGTWPLHAEARSAGHRPGTWATELAVQPDRLTGQLGLGEPEDHRFPARLTLEPAHLDAAPVEVTLEARLADTSLGFREPPIETRADGTAIEHELVALHGPGPYRVHATAESPLTRAWTGEATVTVPEPAQGDTLDVEAIVEAPNATVELANDPINDDDKRKYPGQTLTTRFETENTDYVNVTVYRQADGERIELAQRYVATDETGQAEHAFAHEPLPAGTLWVEGSAGEATARRNASIPDVDPEASIAGPGLAFPDAAPWQGNLTLSDANFGSTARDPGPLQGLPDVDWVLYRGRSSGSAEAEGFTVRIGEDAGTSNGTARTSSLTWPTTSPPAEAADGHARLPVAIEPPPDAEARGYRLSLYEHGTGDLLTTHPFTVQDVDVETLQEPRPGRAWPIEIRIADPGAETPVTLRLLHEGTPLANATVSEDATWEPALPSPMPAGTTLRLEAHVASPGRDEPILHTTIEETVPELGPEVRVHPALDGVPTPPPIALHPANEHHLALAYHAYDPNEGPLTVTDVTIRGPSGPVSWPIETTGQDEIEVDVPAGLPAGRYRVDLDVEGLADPVEALALDAGDIVRLAIDGPEEVRLPRNEPAEMNVTVENRGNLPIEHVRFFLDTELDLDAEVSNATVRMPASEPVGIGLDPGEARELTLELEARGQPGRGELSITVAGVIP